METNIQIFENPNFGQVRTLLSASNEPLFCLADICKALDIEQTSKVKTRLNDRGVTTIPTPTKNQHGAVVIQQMNFITEPNLYRCIFQSRKKEAEQFQDWVCEEVLPAIRKTGGYITTTQEDTPETIMARALLIADSTIKQQSAQLKKQAPKVLFAEAVETSSRSCLIAELAKIITQNGIEVGQNRLFEWMRNNGFLCKSGEYYNQPTQKAMEMGLFEIKKTTIVKPDGTTLVNTTPKVTGKGQIFFVNRFLYNKAREGK